MWQGKLPVQIFFVHKGLPTYSCICAASPLLFAALHIFGESRLYPGVARANSQPQSHANHRNRGKAMTDTERFEAHSLCANSPRSLWGEAERCQFPSDALTMTLLPVLLQQRNFLGTPCSAILFSMPPLAGRPCFTARSEKPSWGLWEGFISDPSSL